MLQFYPAIESRKKLRNCHSFRHCESEDAGSIAQEIFDQQTTAIFRRPIFEILQILR
jgi:hypothetical protein